MTILVKCLISSRFSRRRVVTARRHRILKSHPEGPMDMVTPGRLTTMTYTLPVSKREAHEAGEVGIF